jgi:hypothetical protein
MVHEQGWASTIPNGEYWLSIERGCAKKTRAKVVTYEYSEPEVQPDEKKEQFRPGTPEAIAAAASARGFGSSFFACSHA